MAFLGWKLLSVKYHLVVLSLYFCVFQILIVTLNYALFQIVEAFVRAVDVGKSRADIIEVPRNGAGLVPQQPHGGAVELCGVCERTGLRIIKRQTNLGPSCSKVFQGSLLRKGPR